MTETLTTEQVEAIVAFAAEIEWLEPRVAAGVSALATELLAFRKADVFWDTVSAGPETGPPMQMVDFRRWAAVASKRITAANERADKADAELLALRKRVGELEGAGWQMLDLLKRVVTVLDAEVFDELAADTLLRDAVTFLYTAKEPNGWQDIATAPRDGTHVHVAFAGTSSPQTVAHWFGPPDLPGLRAGNWYLSVQQLEGPPVHPTHWRTLPALPTPKEPS